MKDPRLLLVVSTLGRIESLERLLESVAGQLATGDRLVIVAQRRVDDVAALASRWRARSSGDIRVVTSPLGASLGRNTGVWEGADDIDDALVMFPNDTTTFPAGSVIAIRRALASSTAGAVHVKTPSGARFDLPPVGTPLDNRNVWSVIEMGLVIRLPVFRDLRGFDESIGTGAATPWQAGEVTDLLMRLRARRPDIDTTFGWVHDDEAEVGGIDETAGLTRAESRRKLRAYGRGVGYVYRCHPFPAWQRWAFVLAGLVIGVRRANDYRIADGWTAFAGRWEGVRGRVRRGAADRRAVSR
ncbi:hypothetical protein O1W71_10835 [Microbacterium sp. H37-C3]|uniref:glycosyltransferase family 2 protein n=1 Tax=Microbacterium sp. H37-C3 TaxID=3004354 RepID=UPI0022AFB6E8|nr:hypothetical protein [Microbacterium sp. H37-C3]MCZ4068165.1 hypothetical protein [Microbacterium sp. H37-C3]